MKLICSISSIEEIKTLDSYVDGVMLNDSLDILAQIQLLEQGNLIPIYKLDVMVFPLEIEEVKRKIQQTIKSSCLYYITDLGLAHILKQMGLLARTIYDPITMITNSLDAKEYASYGFHAIGLSNEITIEDTKAILQKSNCKAFLQVFGYRMMLNTRRSLISLYSKKIDKNIPLHDLFLREATRNDYFPIVESERGTKIYRGHLISLLEEIKDLPLEYAFLESFGLEGNTFLQVLKIFHSRIKGNCSQTMDLASLDLPISDGFSYQDSVYMKEEF